MIFQRVRTQLAITKIKFNNHLLIGNVISSAENYGDKNLSTLNKIKSAVEIKIFRF